MDFQWKFMIPDLPQLAQRNPMSFTLTAATSTPTFGAK